MTSPIHAAYCNAACLFRLEEFRDFCLALEHPALLAFQLNFPFDAPLPTGKFGVDDPFHPTLDISIISCGLLIVSLSCSALGLSLSYVLARLSFQLWPCLDLARCYFPFYLFPR